MRRRLLPSARPSVMSAAIFETGSKATTTPVAPAVPRVFAFSMQAEQSIVVEPLNPPTQPGGFFSLGLEHWSKSFGK